MGIQSEVEHLLLNRPRLRMGAFEYAYQPIHAEKQSESLCLDRIHTPLRRRISAHEKRGGDPKAHEVLSFDKYAEDVV